MVVIRKSKIRRYSMSNEGQTDEEAVADHQTVEALRPAIEMRREIADMSIMKGKKLANTAREGCPFSLILHT